MFRIGVVLLRSRTSSRWGFPLRNGAIVGDRLLAFFGCPGRRPPCGPLTLRR